MSMLPISSEMLNKILQHKGMKSITTLSQESGVNRFTLTDILNGKRTIVRKNTFMKLNNWLLQYI